ncbi:amidohydrolase [Flavobacterium sp.]|jgi:omega-amidase|uniref:amidohydrolase n=1 Tax=Flavobacterium sp. TaxID=239 RepID=UPI0025DF4233|nr:amidohydrolase [Flavobacterium sp.]
MKIALIQIPLVWEDPKSNRDYIEQKINTLEADTDLVVLPEMFTTGFTMQPERVAETMQGETIVWMQSLAKAKNCAITGSLVIIEGGNYYNRLLFVFPSGEIHYYNKRHLFTLAGEDKSYTKGTQKLIIEYRGWKICPLICYDLRFPVFARNVEQYDLLLYVANWPTIRIQAWDTLLKARAVENMSYTIGVNRVGKDEKDYDYSGHSQVVDFLGNYAIAPQETEGIFYAQLNKEALLKTRTKLGFLNDQDTFDWK